MGLIELIVMAMFDVVQYIILSGKLVHDRDVYTSKLNRLLLCICFLGFSLSIGFSSYLLDGKYNIFVSGPLLMFMTFLIYRRKIRDTIYVYGITSIMMIIIQLSVPVLLRMVSVELEFNFKSGLLAQTVTLFLAIIIALYVPVNSMFKYVIKGNKVFKFLGLNVFIILVSLLMYWYIDIDTILKNIAIVSIVLIWTILVNFIILKNSLKNEIKEHNLKAYESYLPAIDELIKDVRKKQHECDNHIQKLRMLAITGEENEEIIDSDIIKKEDMKRNSIE
ncbi:hypothetical protein Curi_c06660 [Gottschalkia acidurici 9a]|uniref:Uncharacterized protein n=1 Tax=Gottschalkia acidurici (strain ATCC 7906 / DSM 604 / BCRC 14475 / CIP 104303 / KCTC 5404 / NCIMB 10678 / 9a) TaxID=1128398 RepID=K0AWX6_GOTA9|nr:hypothetical protein [Gottschalkia acidurici]AFS77739.1 hypothetical protein Curi_c06660 [Gottschalkia acidurici 9a]